MYTHSDGRKSAYPFTKKDARAARKPIYNCGYICEHCGISPYRYVRTDECHACARLDALDFYSLALGTAKIQYRHSNISRVTIPKRSTRLLTRRQSDKLLAGLSRLGGVGAGPEANGLYVVPEPCARAGHVGLRDSRKRCATCYHQPPQNRSPRQQAIAAGETWYRPDTPCHRCHQRAMRSIFNGRCECQNKVGRRGRNDIHEQIEALRGAPLGRQESLRLGFKVYSMDGVTWRYTACGNKIPARGGHS